MKPHWIQLCLAACGWIITPTFGVGVESLREDIDALIAPVVEAENGQAVDWNSLAVHIEQLATSTDISGAQQVYLDFLSQMKGGMPWLENPRISQYFRSWLEDALIFTEEPEALAKVHFWLARHLHARADSSSEAERIGRLYEYAVELDALPEAILWDALEHWAQWARDYGIQSFDVRGEVFHESDYAFALELYHRMLAQHSAPSDEALARVEAEIQQIEAPELSWLQPNSFFPDTEIQLRLWSRNLNQVHVELHPVPALEAFYVNSSGALDVRPDQQWRSEALHPTIYTPQPRRPHYADERLLTLPVMEPGAYHLRARSGDLFEMDWVVVSDFALVVQRDSSRLQILAVQSETGQSLENVELRIWFESEDGEWGDFGAAIQQRGPTTFTIPEAYREGAYYIAAKWQNRISLVHGEAFRPDLSDPSRIPAWTIVPDRLRVYRGQKMQWRGIPRVRRADWSDWVDLEAGVVLRWLNPADEVVAETAASVSDTGSLEGDLKVGDDWTSGLYRAAVAGDSMNGHSWESSPVAAFYLREDSNLRIRPEIIFDQGNGALVPVVLASQALEGTVRLTTQEGALVPGAGIRITLRESPDGEALFRIEGLQTNPEGEAPFRIPESGFQQLSDLVWMEVGLSGDASAATSGKWLQVLDQPFDASLSLAERIHRIGDQVQVQLNLSSALELPSSVQGTLIVNRERWQSVYVHRRRGNEITGTQYRELPERSLLGTSQGDFRLREEGFVTEEKRRLDVRVEDGAAFFTLPAGEPGFYRMSWVTPGHGGRSIQADARYWVVGDAQRQMNYRPENLEIIPNGEELLRTRSNRVLIAAPYLNSFALFSEGDGLRKQQRWLELPTRTQLFELDLPTDTGSSTHLEVNAVYQGQWLRDQRGMPIRRGDGRIQLEVERQLSFLLPGQAFEAEVRAVDSQGQPVDVELHTFIRPASEIGIVERMRSLGSRSNVSANPPWKTTSSIESYPYPGSNPRPANDRVEDAWCREMERRLTAELQNLAAMDLQPGGWLPAEKVTDGEASLFSWPLPDVGGDWVLEWIAVDAQGRVAQHREWVSTHDILGLHFDLPAFVRVGDTLNVRFKANNESEATVSGDLDLQIWLNEQQILDEVRPFNLEPGASLIEEIPVQPEAEGRLRVRAEMDHLEDGVHLERTVRVLPVERKVTHWRARALTPASAREVSAKDGRRLTADPWALLGSAAQHTDLLGSDSVDEIAMELLFLGRLLRLELLSQSQLDSTLLRREALLNSIVEAQNSDGGWSWVGQTHSDLWTSALVVFALAESIPVDAERARKAMDHGRQHLSTKLMQNALSPRLLAWVLHATAHYQNRFGSGRPERLEARGFLQLMRDWEQLDPDVQGLLLVIAYQFRFEEEIGMLSDGLLAGPARDEGLEGRLSEGEGWRYPGLQFLLWYRGMLWANPDARFLTAHEPMLVEGLFAGRDPVASARLAQAVFAEYLMLRDHYSESAESSFTRPLLEDWSAEALDSVVADPYIYELSATEAPRRQADESSWAYRRKGELRRLTPTLLRGLVEEVQPWEESDAVVQGSRLRLVWEWELAQPQDRVRIDLPLPAGWAALPESGQHLLRVEPDNLVSHRSYSEESHQLTLFLPQVPEGTFRLAIQLQAQGSGRFQIFAPTWTMQDSREPIRFEEAVIVEIVPSSF